MKQDSKVIEALMKPETYDEVVRDIQLLQTHISYVFLTGKYVYKVKKPVDFEFLDFTTLEKRKFFCEEEVRLNKRLCRDMYLGVVPINVSEDGGIKIKGRGKTIEYAVKMRQFPQEAMMSALLEKNKVSAENIDEIARLLSNFHNKAKSDDEVKSYGSVEVILKNWVQNFEQTRGLRGNVIDANDFDFVEKKVIGFIKKNASLFEKRIKEGRIKECHGDVHSGNIFIHNSRIYIFDAIEFNKMFSCSDVASEIAFLAMDLDFHERQDLSKQFVEKYIEFSDDIALRKLLPFYKCYRAYVRAKINSFKLKDPGLSSKEKEEAEDLTKRYFNIALEYSKEF